MLTRLLALLALGLFASPIAFAQLPAGVIEIKPQLYAHAGPKIEVVEFFWYGCPHCYDLEPHIEQWLEKLPADVEFKRIPAADGGSWSVAARTYFALDAIGLQPKLHRPFFDAVQKERLRPTNTQQMDDWLSRQGVDVMRFRAAENSFAVESKLRRASQLFAQVKEYSQGVPALVVNGRYLIPARVGGPDKMIETLNLLLEQLRKNAKK